MKTEDTVSRVSLSVLDTIVICTPLWMAVFSLWSIERKLDKIIERAVPAIEKKVQEP